MNNIISIQEKDISTTYSFSHLATYFAPKEGTVILLSGGEYENARYNIIATKPWLKISSKGNKLFISENGQTKEITGNPFSLLKNITRKYSENFKSLLNNKDFKNTPITSGLFGYLSYDLKDHIEDIKRTTVDDLKLPDLYMISPQLIIVEDRTSGKLTALAIETDSSNKNSTELLLQELSEAEKTSPGPGRFSISPDGFTSNFNKNEYENSISDIIDYIKEGDIYQVNMSQRFSTDFSGDSYSLFTELFKENPASFFAYIHCGDHQIVSTSPERFILLDKKRVEAKPIKGTRPRGKTEEEDKKLIKELQESPKDAAELSMIVDLLRNDIGKVCKGGSVRVLKHKDLETYKNVHHLVSTIEGYLEEDKDSTDLLEATFPGGSITGCPKIRSMEIIDEKEPFRRHLYTGSIGYIGFNGRMDLSIVIRTATITRDKLFFSVGGGIVYDSDPADEYDETLHKAQSLMKVLNLHKAKAYQTEDESPRLSAKNYCWSEGKFIPEEDGRIPLLSGGYQYGRGVFETIRVDKGRIEYLVEHLSRLERGCREVLGLESQKLNWKEIITILINKNMLMNSIGVVKIMISEGKSGLFLDTNYSVTCRKYIMRKSIQENNGLSLGIYPHRRESFLADHKTMNYLYYLKAGEWVKINGFDEAVILNADGSVSETNTGNILIIQDKTVIVPESKHRLKGIMEGKVLENYEQKGFKILTKVIMPEELYAFQTILITNSLIGVSRTSSAEE